MNDLYAAVARFYDEINADIDYERWADFLAARMEEASLPVREVLDLACGTGSMTLPLARRGYDMIGVDLSPDMLNVARTRAEREAKGADILFLCQNMCEFELFGTVQAAVCCLDSVNHLTKVEELRKTLSLLHNYLEPNGLLIFDVNTHRKFEEIYGNQVYAFDFSAGFAVWQNEYHPRGRVCDFDITLFLAEGDGRYVRRNEWQRERYYPTVSLVRYLREAGFSQPTLYDDDFHPVTMGREAEGAYRLHFVCHAEK